MTTPYAEILMRLAVAVLAGGLIGFERSFHGRPAGFRTHTLVSLSSALLMVAAVYESLWFTAAPLETLRVDPTRMAQGIMTGIGFLGAGVILKAGFSVRGLTTAASIWTTAAIGILAGIGFYLETAAGVVLTLGALAGFRWIESRMPRRYFAHLTVHYARGEEPNWAELHRLVSQHGFSIANVAYRLKEDDRLFSYSMALRARESAAARRLAETLLAQAAVKGFEIEPTAE
jgi:putative Mg2+ transporter-C (MgtC) family protein